MVGVVDGSKRQTLRLGEDNFDENEVVRLETQEGTLKGYLCIRSKDTVLYGQITEEDAKVHGWSLAVLKERLKRFYPEITDEATLTRYQFQYLTFSEYQQLFSNPSNLLRELEDGASDGL